MLSIKDLTSFFTPVTGAPKGVKYIPVERMLEAMARRDAFNAHAADADNIWTPTQAQLDASATGSFSMLEFVKKILNQGQLGSCTAYGWAGAVALKYAMKTGVAVFLATLYIYFYERFLNGTVNDDSGADVKDGANVLSTRGAPLESSYPYNDDGVAFKNTPPVALDAEAAKYKVVKPLQVSPQVPHLKAALKAGMPIIFGFMVYDSFESSSTASTGVVTMPTPDEQMLGGHCVFAIGYTDSAGTAKFFKTSDAVKHQLMRAVGSVTNTFRAVAGLEPLALTPPADCLIGVNSWGKGWGDKGVFYMPWTFVQKYAMDYYVFEDVTTA